MNIAGQSALEATAGYWNTAAAAIEQHAFIGGRGGGHRKFKGQSWHNERWHLFDTLCGYATQKKLSIFFRLAALVLRKEGSGGKLEESSRSHT